MYDYVISLREGIMDAWGGIIGAMKISDKSEYMRKLGAEKAVLTSFVAHELQQHVQSIFELLNVIANDMNRSESLMRASMGVIG